MTDITALKKNYVEVGSFEDSRARAAEGYVQVMLTNVSGKLVIVMAPESLFADAIDQKNQAIEFVKWYSEKFTPDTSNVVPEPTPPMEIPETVNTNEQNFE